MHKETTKNGGPERVEKSDVAQREEEMFAFWNEHDIFNKSLKKESPNGDFVFYDGPPFATGLPHYGHILAGTIKDAIPRFQAMNGYHVERKWGWDCHGLPLENIIEKRLGLTTKRDIEAMGVKQFNEAARDAVLEYADDWRKIIPRMGRFVDMEDDYRTMDASYTESVWWVFSELNKKGLVYEGFKSMHLCPRCGTTLSNFEVNQGYKDIKDIAVTVKLPLLDDAGNVTDTSLLVWTTTPWTLPGNMAAAVHKDEDYLSLELETSDVEGFPLKKGEKIILANSGDLIIKLFGAPLGYGPHPHEGSLEWVNVNFHNQGNLLFKNLRIFKGQELVGTRYVPPFDVYQNQEFKNKENAWKIYHADYVELGEEGTGAVHLAPAYGEEDMELAKQENIPIMHHVDADGRFKDFVTHFAGQLVKPKDDDKVDVTHLDADIEVVKRLKDAGRLFKKENITHSYPHCWRCDTPLLNYATTSWFVRVTDIKDKLVAENNTVKWVPEHVGANRFGRWLEGARDWAVSRQRYWGAPLPIWRNEKTQEYKIIGSLAELQQYVPKSGNTYFLTRHGESEFNTQCVLNGAEGVKNGLTERGREQARQAAALLRENQIDYIYHSPLERTTETARIIAEEIGLSIDCLVPDPRIIEMQFGTFEGKLISEYHAFFKSGADRLAKAPDGGENWTDVKRRVGDFLYEIEAKHKNARILIVSHNGPVQMMHAVQNGDDSEQAGKHIDENTYDIDNAEVRAFPFSKLPHNDNYELDFHRPYIDEVELRDADGEKLVRVPDVFDCWFESGAMPYAQNHYPFENLDTFNPEKGIGYPANFIAEGLDQTRGWFYSLIVLGTALFGKSPYQNVVVNGLALAEDGKKMSKSLQNYPDPMDLVHRVGADAMRFYLLTSPIVRGEDLNFSEKEVLELQRKNLGRLHNVLAMYETYADGTSAAVDSTNVLDRWMLARLNETVRDITNGYANYELDKATRPIEGLIDDISVWYLRRSRERLKGEDVADKQATLATLRYVLKQLALIMAPVMPFYAEYLFLRVREENDAESVHLMLWPKGGEVEGHLIADMTELRKVVTLALEARTKAGIKVRQPLQKLEIFWTSPSVSSMDELIMDEVNVKEIVHQTHDGATAVQLDTVITPELKIEGEVRELMRAIQDARKEMGLMPQDKITLLLDDATKLLVETFEAEVLRTVGAIEVRVDSAPARTLEVNGITYRFEVEKK